MKYLVTFLAGFTPSSTGKLNPKLENNLAEKTARDLFPNGYSLYTGSSHWKGLDLVTKKIEVIFEPDNWNWTKDESSIEGFSLKYKEKLEKIFEHKEVLTYWQAIED